MAVIAASRSTSSARRASHPWAAARRRIRPGITSLAYAVADLAEAERELKARGIYYWIYDSLVGDASKQVFFEDSFGNMIELQQEGRAHDAPVG